MTISEKIAQCRENIAAKQRKLASNKVQLAAAKSCLKSLVKEIAELEAEIKRLQVEQMLEKLAAKGISPAEIEQAIEAGIFDKSENDKNCATNSTISSNEPIKEDNPDEISGS